MEMDYVNDFDQFLSSSVSCSGLQRRTNDTVIIEPVHLVWLLLASSGDTYSPCISQKSVV